MLNKPKQTNEMMKFIYNYFVVLTFHDLWNICEPTNIPILLSNKNHLKNCH